MYPYINFILASYKKKTTLFFVKSLICDLRNCVCDARVWQRRGGGPVGENARESCGSQV